MEENKAEKFTIGSICHLVNSDKFFLFSKCPKAYRKKIEKALKEIRDKKNDVEAEDCFFSHLIEPDNNIGQQLWRYMPLSSFKKLCELGTITMSSIISMNDKSETCYANSYISSYIGDKFHEESENPTDICTLTWQKVSLFGLIIIYKKGALPYIRLTILKTRPRTAPSRCICHLIT